MAWHELRASFRERPRMGTQYFTSMSSKKMASLIGEAHHRVVVAAPALTIEVADAIEVAKNRPLDAPPVVIMDCDEEVFRLGYGVLAATTKLKESACETRQCSGLRIGVLICDERAWIFSPTALLVQPEVHSDETPNAVELPARAVEQIVWRLSPRARETAKSEELQPDLLEELETATTEIGVQNIYASRVEQVKRILEVAPPLPFDVARQVRVFTPYLQYVDIHLAGCAIQRRRVVIPKSIYETGAGAEIQGRLKTTFELIEKSSAVSSKQLENELQGIRQDLTRSLGRPWGRVILRSVRALLDTRIVEFREKLKAHKAKVTAELENHLNESRKQVVDCYLPSLREHPPDAVLGELLFQKPSDDQLRDWLDGELSRVFPEPEQLVHEMQLHVHFRDVTHETLIEDGFAEALATAYPRVNWDKPFHEFTAAKERDERSRK